MYVCSHILLQGVTLEDLKSAEQLVKKKQQQENAQRTTELQQLVQEQVAEHITRAAARIESTELQ